MYVRLALLLPRIVDLMGYLDIVRIAANVEICVHRTVVVVAVPHVPDTIKDVAPGNVASPPELVSTGTGWLNLVRIQHNEIFKTYHIGESRCQKF